MHSFTTLSRPELSTKNTTGIIEQQELFKPTWRQSAKSLEKVPALTIADHGPGIVPSQAILHALASSNAHSTRIGLARGAFNG